MTFKAFISALAASFGVPWLLIIVVPFGKMRNLDAVHFDGARIFWIGSSNQHGRASWVHGHATTWSTACAPGTNDDQQVIDIDTPASINIRAIPRLTPVADDGEEIIHVDLAVAIDIARAWR